MTLASFGQQLRIALVVAEMTQTEMAEKVGAGQSTVSDWCRGKLEPPPTIVFAIERILSLAPGTLSADLGYVPTARDPTEPNTWRAKLLDALAEAPLADEQRRLILGVLESFAALHAAHPKVDTRLRKPKLM